MENPYKKHRDALRTWNEFVKVNRARGMHDAEIALKLQANNIDPEVIPLLIDRNDNSQRRAALSKGGKWKIAVGVVKLILGLAALMLSLAGGPGLFPGILLIVTGLMWLAAYAKQD
jgi:hypothetical protein